METYRVMDCVLSLNADGLWQCANCQWVFSRKSESPPRRNCPASPDLQPAAARLGLKPDAKTFSLRHALAKYAAGQPLGPGDWLHIYILRWTKESPKANCGCESKIAQMNAWGPAGCREHQNEIVGWLYQEACNRGWWKYAAAVPGSKMFIRRLVRKAIAKAISNGYNTSGAKDGPSPPL